ncbi:MAG: AAA family ATPase [Actinomycetota bacterium]
MTRAATALGIAFPKDSWPLVARDEELRHLSKLLRLPRSAAILVGPAGIGKTRLAREFLQFASAEGFVSIRVTPSLSTSHLPFGAFAPLLPDPAPSNEQAALIGAVARSIADRGNGRPVVLFVDDAHLLDNMSLALTHRLATTDGIVVVAAARSDAPATPDLVALWKDEFADRLELRPFSPEQVHDLLEAALTGPVDAGTAHLLWERSQGNPLFLRELVAAALDEDVLSAESGTWRLRREVPVSRRLVEFVTARMSGAGPAARKALNMLAVHEPLSLLLLHRLAPDADLEALEHDGLIHFDARGRRRELRLGHPLYADVLRSEFGGLGYVAAARSIADAIDSAGGRRRDDPLLMGVLQLEGGGPVKPDVLARAAAMARERFNFGLAERLARGAVEAGAGFDTTLLLGQLLWLQGRAEEAEHELAKLVLQASTDSERSVLAGTRMTVLYVGLDKPQEALKVLDEAEATIEDLTKRDQITTERARLLARIGRYQDSVSLIEPLLERTQDQALVAACMAAANSMALVGRTSDAIEVTERGLAAHLAMEGPPAPFGPFFHLVLRCHALVLAGQIEAARNLASEERLRAVRSGSTQEHAFFSMLLGVAELAAGRVGTAARMAEEARQRFRELNWAIFVRICCSTIAHAAALRSNLPRAREMVSEANALGLWPSDFYGPEVLRAEAWTEVAAGDSRRGFELLEKAALVARSGGALALEAAALHDLARLGHAASVAPRLAELRLVVEGSLATARSNHASALAARNAKGLESASAEFETLGSLLLAAEASADAAVVWSQLGEPRRATWAGRRSTAQLAPCEGARTPTLSIDASTRAALTSRELEIARLARDGLSNKEIARRLVLSHRTVENKLHSAYIKLGVHGRKELVDALEPP